ncbi:SURF1 family protein [Thalassotalea euphylliae]|uniref:SURF1-like protein n=1 Tax=Thalassotalea euphylliae TaxID=1655234 RepID=A0A3E0U2A0_9GAMM|nr:SURF1 family protein [Thalassotalea euphylliae]REL31111.1 SURF1 family protein [Thalassotalea euphylliae]
MSINNAVSAKISPLWVLVTLLVFSALIKLGLWQSERAEQKEQRILRMEQLMGVEPKPLHQVLNSINTLNAESLSDPALEETRNEMLNDQPVVLNGVFNDEVLLLLDNQTLNGQLGYRVYQVFYHQQQLPVLVNLGWVSGSRNRSELPIVEPITGHHQITGNIRVIEPNIVLAEQEYDQLAMPMRVQQIEVDKLSDVLGVQLQPFAIYLDSNEVIGYQKTWRPIVMPPSKHRGYAFQWFSLAAAWLILMIWAAIKNNKKVVSDAD